MRKQTPLTKNQTRNILRDWREVVRLEPDSKLPEHYRVIRGLLWRSFRETILRWTPQERIRVLDRINAALSRELKQLRARPTDRAAVIREIFEADRLGSMAPIRRAR